MDHHHLRAIILKLQDRLSDHDRRRLHFFLGNDVPRRIRDDPSLAGTLCLMESLFDQDKINEQDFTFLIDAFDEIQCIDAVKVLRGKPSGLIPAFLPDRPVTEKKKKMHTDSPRTHATNASQRRQSIGTEFDLNHATEHRSTP